ncbi:hypothetical protein AB0C10_15685 [Microbispora amethystogenes]
MTKLSLTMALPGDNSGRWVVIAVVVIVVLVLAKHGQPISVTLGV